MAGNKIPWPQAGDAIGTIAAKSSSSSGHSISAGHIVSSPPATAGARAGAAVGAEAPLEAGLLASSATATAVSVSGVFPAASANDAGAGTSRGDSSGISSTISTHKSPGKMSVIAALQQRNRSRVQCNRNAGKARNDDVHTEAPHQHNGLEVKARRKANADAAAKGGVEEACIGMVVWAERSGGKY